MCSELSATAHCVRHKSAHHVGPTYASRVLWLEKELFLQSYLTVDSD